MRGETTQHLQTYLFPINKLCKMKTLTLLFALSLLILLNPTHSIRNYNPIRLPTADLVALAASDTPVLDIDGDELRPGRDYTIYSFTTGGGVRLAGATDCPSDVVLSNDDYSADPIIITPEDTLESTPLTFKFNITTIPPTCENNNLFWEIHYDPESGIQIVKTGDDNVPQFKIEPVDISPIVTEIARVYRITHCYIDQCYNVTTFYDNSINATRLALSDHDDNESFLQVMFQKHTPPVLDADGYELLAGAAYNILSIDEPEGEVALIGLDNTTECPSDVIIQDKLGDPIMFMTMGINQLVLESIRLDIKFNSLDPNPYCSNKVYWNPQYDPISDQTFVKAVGNYSGLFRIERAPSLPGTHFYKITYCSGSDTPCSNVATYKDKSVDATRLVLTTHTFQPFVFKRFATPL